MSSLRSLITPAIPQVAPPQEFMVWNTSHDQSNGGRCCLWTVPSGVTWVTFQLWGGGGSGAGACCCQQGWPGGSGAYAVKTITTAAGCQYTICAASSGCSHTSCCGLPGYTTWVTGYNLSNFCAAGGTRGDTGCWRGISCYTCLCMNPCCAYACGADFWVGGTHGGFQPTQFCYHHSHQYAPTGPHGVAGPFISTSMCGVCAGCLINNPGFPGGGGMSAFTHDGNCRCGGWGAGGLVSVLFG